MTSARRLAAIAARARTQPVLDEDAGDGGGAHRPDDPLEEGCEQGLDLRLPRRLQGCVVEEHLDLATWRPRWPPTDRLADWMLAAKVTAWHALVLERHAWAEVRDLDPRDLPPLTAPPRFADPVSAQELLGRALAGETPAPRRRARKAFRP